VELYEKETQNKRTHAQNEDEEADSPSIEGKSPERQLLSRKAQQTLRKIRAIKKDLLDNSVRAEIEEVLGKAGLESLPQENDTHEENHVKEVEQQPASGTTMGQLGSQEDTEMENVEIPQETAANIPRLGISRTTSVPPSRHELEICLNPQVEPTTINPQSSTLTARDSSGGKNVWFAAATPGQTIVYGSTIRTPPDNSYARKTASQDPVHGSSNIQQQPQKQARVDKAITLKKSNSRPHIHRYTLCFKTIKAKSEDENYQIIQETLQRFLEIALQVDPKTIMPPYLELDRNDRSVTDLSQAFTVSSIDSYHALKKYFFRLSPRDDEGVSWCSSILAQAMPFSAFMDKAKYSLENNDFSLWPKASDNENTTDVGWLLYSTRAQDEERLSALLSEITGEHIGVKWKPIRSSNAKIRKKDQTPNKVKVKALHVECTVDRLQEVRDKLTLWYSSSSRKFPDGMKMRLVPTISAMTSINNRT
jgi:hypothetical protein